MRYYAVDVTRADGTPYLFKSLGGMRLTSLLPSGPQNPATGLTNLSALQIELDLPMAIMNDPTGEAYLRVWGLGLQDLGSASDLNGLNVSIYAGMAKGLPLANPAQAGLVMKGQIFQAFGNWISTDQTLDMLFQPGGSGVGSTDSPQNFPFSWPAGTQLSTAIANTLSIALPNLKQSINVSQSLVQDHDETDHKPTLAAFASYINATSRGVVGGTTYPGITIATEGQTINVFDGAGPSTPTAIAISPQDLVGQPTWVDTLTISIKTILRADVKLNDTISLPPTLVTTTAGATPRFQDRTAFSGNYRVTSLHHYGNLRQPDAASWASVFEATPGRK